MNFGLLGPGSIARKFADACSRTEGVKLLAVASGSRWKKCAEAMRNCLLFRR